MKNTTIDEEIHNLYSNIETLPSGILTLSTPRLKRLAKLIGGDYNSLSPISKKIFRSDAVFELIYSHTDFSKYLKHN